MRTLGSGNRRDAWSLSNTCATQTRNLSNCGHLSLVMRQGSWNLAIFAISSAAMAGSKRRCAASCEGLLPGGQECGSPGLMDLPHEMLSLILSKIGNKDLIEVHLQPLIRLNISIEHRKGAS